MIYEDYSRTLIWSYVPSPFLLAFFISIIIQQFSGLGCARSSLGFPTLPMEWSGTIAVARYGSWQGHSKHQQAVSDMDRYSFKRLVASPIPSKISKTMVK